MGECILTRKGGSMTWGTKTASGAGSSSIAFTGLSVNPKTFNASAEVSPGEDGDQEATVVYNVSDGVYKAIVVHLAASDDCSATIVNCTAVFSSGTLTLTLASGLFVSGTTYTLYYAI